MASGYIGKISAVVTANTSDLSRRLAAARGEFNTFANRLELSIGAASRKAGDSIDSIFTRYQRLERSLRSALEINLRTDREIKNIQQLVSVAEQINRPLASAASQVEKLGLGVQGAFLPALRAAQSEAERLSEALRNGGLISERAFAGVEGTVNRTTQAIQRLTQAQQLASQSFTGNELQFGNPRLFETLSANAKTTQRAAALPASALVDGDIARQIRALEQYQNAAVEAAARVESLRLEPNVNPEVLIAAERRFKNIIETARRAGEQVRQAVEVAENIGASTQRVSTVDPSGRSISDRIQGQAAVRRAVEEEASFRQRAADAAEREAAAVERLSQSQNRLLAQEIQRNSGASARRNAAAFDAATAGVLNRQAPDAGVFERQTRTLESELQRTARLRQQFLALPEDVQQSLERERAALNNIGTAARDGAASLGLLAQANDRMAASIEEANARLTEQERLARASGQLTIDTAESDRLSRESGLERNAGASTRLIDRVGPSVTALRGQLDGLAEPLRASVGPEVDRITNKFRLLSRDGVAQSAEAVQRLKGEIAGLNAALESRRSIGRDFLQSFGGSGTAGLGLGVDQRSLRAIGAEIEFVQTRLASLGQQARGPVLAALEALRVAANRLFQDGAIDTDEGRAELERLRQELIRVAATAENVKPDQFGAALKRAGDIARGSFGNVGLAVQQAAFAFEDFFSVTGGLDQRIRAAGNNLSQLGFILGSTKGLIAGIVIGVGAQFAAMLIKWANNGKTAEDQTKALNDALSRQKSIAEDIARAFESLAETFSRGIFSEAGEQARQLSSRLEEIARRQRELRDSRVADLDPAVQQERTTQATLQRQLEAEPNAGRRVAIEREIARSRGREQEAARAAAAAAGPTVDEATQAIRRAADREFAVRTRGDDTVTAADARILEDARGRTAAAAGAAPAELQRILQQQLDSLTRSGAVAVDAAAADSAAELGRLIAGLQRRIAEVTDEQVVALFESIDQPAQRIRQAQDIVAQALEAGIPGARELATAVDAASTELTAAEQRIIDRLNAGQPVDQELADAARQQRDAAVKAFEAEQQKNAAIDSTRRSLETFSAALDRVSTELANTVAQEARGLADQARRDANREQGIVDAGLGGRQGDADAAAQRRGRLEAEADSFARRAARIEAANARARVDFARQAAAGGLGERAQDLIRQRDQAQAVIDNRQSPADDVTNARATLNVINTELQQIFEQSEAGQAAANLADELNKAAAAAARLDELIQRGRELDLSPAEQAGRELAEDIRAIQERLAADLPLLGVDADAPRIIAAEGVDSAKGAAGLLRREGLDEAADLLEDAAADIARVREDAFRQQAPAIFGLADQVQNAVLQGPSRAALEATDVSTVEGARELNRLLRGDDAARNQDLVQLQREANNLLRMIAEANRGLGVAN